MELGLEGFKSGIGVEVVRGVGGLGSKQLELGSEKFGSSRSEGLRSGIGFGKLGLGGGVRRGWGSWDRGDWV